MIEIEMILPAQVDTVMSGLRDHGYEAYLVGGCVRDTLLGHSPLDYDVATNATPRQVGAALAPPT